LRRQAASRPLPAGSSRAERLDPISLPLRFAPDAGSAGTDVRAIELHTDHVVLLRALAGGKMTISLPLSSYYGVAIRLQPPTRAEHGCAAIVLEHPDPQFSVTLNRAADVRDIASQWQCWGQALELPLLVVDSDGSLREPFASNGSIQMGSLSERAETPARTATPASTDRLASLCERASRRTRDHRAQLSLPHSSGSKANRAFDRQGRQARAWGAFQIKAQST
jgi:hypothetical protein